MSSKDGTSAPPGDLTSLIGKVTISYNRVQYMWLLQFQHYLMGDKNLARAMFEALRNDSSQRDIIMAAATVALRRDSAVLEDTKRLMDETGRLAGERNAAIHTIWDQEVISGKRAMPGNG